MKKQTALFILLITLVSFGCSKKSSNLNLAQHTEEAIRASDAFFKHPEEINLYNPIQANAENIKNCVFQRSEQTSCAVSESPFIGYGKELVTVDDILNKTMASRASYMETFKKIISNMPPEALQMFGAVNAIVISERILPSFYNPLSGAIYLSSTYFWLTPEEKALIVTKDYRGAYGQTLQFSEDGDYIKSGESIYKINKKTYRTAEELIPYTSKVLFHELSHANDFFPRSFYNSNELQINDSFYTVAYGRDDSKKTLSQNFKTTLSSKILLRMGEVLYQGEKENNSDLAVTADTIVSEYKNDVAVDFYAYSTPNEDFAMLVERAMMYKYHQYKHYAVIIQYPKANFTIPEDFDYPIAGGIKNKIADPKVKERAIYAIEAIFNKKFADEVEGNLADLSVVDIPAGTAWSDVTNF